MVLRILHRGTGLSRGTALPFLSKLGGNFFILVVLLQNIYLACVISPTLFLRAVYGFFTTFFFSPFLHSPIISTPTGGFVDQSIPPVFL